MPATVLQAAAVTREIYARMRERVAALGRLGVHPGLAAIQVGDDPASRIYVRNKVRACSETGIRSEVHHLDADCPQEALLAALEKLVADKRLVAPGELVERKQAWDDAARATPQGPASARVRG